MEINPKLLTASGRKKLKKIESQPWSHDYESLRWDDFKAYSDFNKFRERWEIHKVLREIYEGSGVEENEDYDGGFDATPQESAIYGNIAKIIVGLRQEISQAQEEGAEANRRLDSLNNI